MTCPSPRGTGIPHVSEVRDTERSVIPPSTKAMTSFRRLSGRMNFGFLSYNARSGFWNFDSRKKYDGSFRFSAGLRQSGHDPSTSCRSVQYDSQGVQYHPSYVPG